MLPIGSQHAKQGQKHLQEAGMILHVKQTASATSGVDGLTKELRQQARDGSGWGKIGYGCSARNELGQDKTVLGWGRIGKGRSSSSGVSCTYVCIYNMQCPAEKQPLPCTIQCCSVDKHAVCKQCVLVLVHVEPITYHVSFQQPQQYAAQIW